MELDLDFGGIGTTPEDGVYLLEVVKVTVKPTKAGDSKNLNVQLKCIEMNEAAFEGHTVWETLSLKPGARWKVQEFLEGVTGKDWRDDSMQLDIDELPGLTSYATCYQDEYNGKVSLKVRTWLGDSSEGGSVPSGDGTRSL